MCLHGECRSSEVASHSCCATDCTARLSVLRLRLISQVCFACRCNPVGNIASGMLCHIRPTAELTAAVLTALQQQHLPQVIVMYMLYVESFDCLDFDRPSSRCALSVHISVCVLHTAKVCFYAIKISRAQCQLAAHQCANVQGQAGSASSTHCSKRKCPLCCYLSPLHPHMQMLLLAVQTTTPIWMSKLC